MNRTELAEAVASKTGLDRKTSEAAVEAVTGSIVAEIKAGNRVSIFGFGSFEPRARAARTARNPQTQATVKVPASKTVAFKPAAAFKETLNTRGRGGAKKATAAKTTAAKSTKAAASKTAKAATKTTARTSPAKAATARSTAARTTAANTASKTAASKTSAAKKTTAAKATRTTKKR